MGYLSPSSAMDTTGVGAHTFVGTTTVHDTFGTNTLERAPLFRSRLSPAHRAFLAAAQGNRAMREVARGILNFLAEEGPEESAAGRGPDQVAVTLIADIG